MNARERFNAVMQFEKPDRLPFMEFMLFWPETTERWVREGMPADADPVAYFGFDPFQWLPVDFNFVPPFDLEVLEEDETTRVVRDAFGVIKREFKHGSEMPHYIEFPMKTRADFLELKERLDPACPERYPADWDGRVKTLRGRDHPVGLVSRGFLAFFRDFMNFNDMLVAFMEQPDWIAEVMDFFADFLIRLWEKAVSEVEIDMVLLGEDMAMKTGPMVPPDFVAEMMVPRYKKVGEFLRAHGVNARFIDSDGDIRPLVPLFLEGGFTGVLPLENNANCSPVVLREAHPRLQMIGGIDKQVIALGGDHIEREVAAKVGAIGSLGGYIPSFDHSVHPEVSFESYKKYLAVLRDYCESAGTPGG